MEDSADFEEHLDALAKSLAEASASAPTRCIHDDTVLGAAREDALAVVNGLRGWGVIEG